MMKRFLMMILLIFSAVVISACSTTQSELINPDEYVSQFTETGAEHLLIDVRTPSEFASGHIEGAINIPVDQIASRLNEIPSDIPVVVYCRSGNRSATAASTLVQNDYSQVYDLGGVNSWTSAGYPLQ